jgi:type II secretory pathway component GspD/PulD (secretin)
MIGRWLAVLTLVTCLGAGADRGAISLDVQNAQLVDVLIMLGAQAGVNVVADASVKPQAVTLHLHDVTFQEALTVLSRSYALGIRRVGDVLIVGMEDSVNRSGESDGDGVGGSTVVLTLVHAQAQDVAREIAAALPMGTVIVPDSRTDSIVVSADGPTVGRARVLVSALDASADGAAATQAHVYALHYEKAKDVESVVKGVLPTASVAADDAQNAIVVLGDEGAQRSAAAFLASIDVPAPQVLFEVRVVDVEPTNDTTNFGIELGGVDSGGNPIDGAATYTLAKGTIAVNARLNALVSEGRAEILATPKLLTLNNREASLLIGETYPVVYYASAFGSEQVQFVDVGVKLRLTPTIGADGSVTTDIHPEYSEIEGFAQNGLPIIANRKIDSTLRAENDQTIVLGGLLRDASSETLTKVPGLSSIPVLGKFFQNKATTHQRDEVVFLITPHIIYPGQKAPDK